MMYPLLALAFWTGFFTLVGFILVHRYRKNRK